MPEVNTGNAEQDRLLDDLCDMHQTPKIKHLEHIGDGASRWSKPYCPLCEELKVAGNYEKARAAWQADRRDKAAEQPAPQSVKAAAEAGPAKSL